MDTTTLALTAFSTIPTIPCIQETISLVYSTIQKIRSHQYAEIVHKHIASLDVETPIQSIELFIQQDTFGSSEITALCTKRIHQSIELIHKLLEEIELKLNSYQKSWIQWLKGVNVYYILEDLKKEKCVLEGRIDTLMQLLMIQSIKHISQTTSTFT